MMSIVDEHLKYFDIEMDEVRRWWPLGRDRTIVVDPKHHFGAPTVEGVLAQTISDHVVAGDSPELVAELFNLSLEAVADAIEWAEHLQKAA